ncbi:MAG: HEAT repeat domain-containing protein, partial [Deltaproteobacteria bacterium]|nr:HEAT repeat domain-containing protein [Deltaproteobacteria bacterium]
VVEGDLRADANSVALRLLDKAAHLCPGSETSTEALFLLMDRLRLSSSAAELSAIYAKAVVREIGKDNIGMTYAAAIHLARAGYVDEAEAAWNQISSAVEGQRVGGKRLNKKEARCILEKAMLQNNLVHTKMRALFLGPNHEIYERAFRMISPSEVARMLGVEKEVERLGKGAHYALLSLNHTEQLVENRQLTDSALSLLEKFETRKASHVTPLLESLSENTLLKACSLMGKDSAIAELGTRFNKSGIHNREQIANVLWWLYPEKAIEHFMEALSGTDAGIKVVAVNTLSDALMSDKPPDPTVNPISKFFELLNDSSPLVQEAACKALLGLRWQIESSAEVEMKMVRGFSSTDPKARRAAIILLGCVGEDDSSYHFSQVVRALSDGDIQVRIAASKVMGSEVPEGANDELLSAVPQILINLTNPNAQLRQQSARALIRLEQVEVDWDSGAVVQALSKVLVDKEEGVRKWAALALGKLKGRQGFRNVSLEEDKLLAMLFLLLKDNDQEVRKLAAVALSYFDDAEVTTHLIEAVDDSEPSVQQAAIGVLAKKQEKALSSVPKLLSWVGVSRLRKTVSKAVLSIGEQSIPTIVEFIQDKERDTFAKIHAIAILKSFGKKAQYATPVLLQLIKEPDVELRKHTVRALGKIGSPAAIPALQAALKDSDSAVREAAGEAIIEMGLENPQSKR